jgi:hypothetical protein
MKNCGKTELMKEGFDMRNKKYMLFIMALFFAATMFFAAISSASDTGEELDEGMPSALAIECTLSMPPFVRNGEPFTFQLNYSPLAPHYRTEKFNFFWPTRCADLGEFTLRQKSFGLGGATSSVEDAVAPADLCIEGVGFVFVSVSNWTGPVCSAYRLFSVQDR